VDKLERTPPETGQLIWPVSRSGGWKPPTNVARRSAHLLTLAQAQHGKHRRNSRFRSEIVSFGSRHVDSRGRVGAALVPIERRGRLCARRPPAPLRTGGKDAPSCDATNARPASRIAVRERRAIIIRASGRGARSRQAEGRTCQGSLRVRAGIPRMSPSEPSQERGEISVPSNDRACGRGSACGRRQSPRRRRLPLLDGPHRLAGHPSEGADLSFQGDRLGGEAPMLKCVPIATGSPAAGPVHPADARSPHRRRSALKPAPLRFGVASRRLVHRPVPGVEPPFFSAPTPSVGALTLPTIACPPSATWTSEALENIIEGDRSTLKRSQKNVINRYIGPKLSPRTALRSTRHFLSLRPHRLGDRPSAAFQATSSTSRKRQGDLKSP
jgi:hypothetical protein